jgi:hypothetical protein
MVKNGDSFAAIIPASALSIGGIANYRIEARDINNNVVSTSIYPVTVIDSVAPIVSHRQVTTASAYAALRVYVTATDPGGISAVRLYYRTNSADDWNSTTGSVRSFRMRDMGSTFETVIPAASVAHGGTLQYYVVVKDSNNNMSAYPPAATANLLGGAPNNDNYRVNVTVQDNDAPVIKHEPVQKALINTTAQVIASVEDNVTVSAKSVKYRVSGTTTWNTAAVVNNSNTNFNCSIPVGIELREIQYYIEALDSAGNTSNWPSGGAAGPQVIQVLDTTSPMISHYPDLSGANLPKQFKTVTINASAVDNGTIIQVRLFYTINGAAQTPLAMSSVGGSFYRTSIAGAGLGTAGTVVTYSISALDDGSNTAWSDVYSFTVVTDNTAPEATLLDPVVDITSKVTQSIRVKALDDVALNTKTLIFNGSSFAMTASGNDTFEYAVNFSNGNNTFNVVISDLAGNKTTVNKTVVLQSQTYTAANVTINIPVGAMQTNAPPAVQSVTTRDVRFALAGGFVSANRGATVSAVIVDFVVEEETQVTGATFATWVTINMTVPADINTANIIPYYWDAANNKWSVAGLDWTSPGLGLINSTTFLFRTSHFTAFTLANQSDNTAPSLGNLSLIGIQTFSAPSTMAATDTSILVTINLTDAVSGIGLWSIKLDGVEKGSGNGNGQTTTYVATASFTGLSAGSAYTVVVSANDMAGAVNTTVQTFTFALAASGGGSQGLQPSVPSNSVTANPVNGGSIGTTTISATIPQSDLIGSERLTMNVFNLGNSSSYVPTAGYLIMNNAGALLVGAELKTTSRNSLTFSQPVTVTIYANFSGIVTEGVYVMYWDVTANAWLKNGISVQNVLSDRLVFTTTHFTVFALFTDTVTPQITSLLLNNTAIVSGNSLNTGVTVSITVTDNVRVTSYNVYVYKDDNTLLAQSTTQSVTGNGTYVYPISYGFTIGTRYYVKVLVSDVMGNTTISQSTIFNYSAVPTPPGVFTLTNVMSGPNPFNPNVLSAHIQYDLGQAAWVKLYIHDMRGNLVHSNRNYSLAGRNEFLWNGRDGDYGIVANGVYFAYLIAEDVASGSTLKKLVKIAVIK